MDRFISSLRVICNSTGLMADELFIIVFVAFAALIGLVSVVAEKSGKPFLRFLANAALSVGREIILFLVTLVVIAGMGIKFLFKIRRKVFKILFRS